MPIRFKFILLLFLSFVFLNANVKSYDEIKNEPKSLVKDYYIYRYITETNYKKDEVKALSKQIYRNRGKLNKEIYKIIPKPKPYDECKNFWVKNISDANLTCKLKRSTPTFLKKLNKQTLKSLEKDFANFPDKLRLLKSMSSENPAVYFAKNLDIKNFFSYYNSLSQSQKNSDFNIALSKEFANELGKEKTFNSFIADIVINKRYANLRKSFLDVNASKFNSLGAFYLGINAVLYDDLNKAYEFFKVANKTFQSGIDKDKANLWAYLVSSNEVDLLNTAKSDNINVYSLYAKELAGFNKTLNLVIPNPTKNKAPKGYDPTDPFSWVKLKNKISKIDKASLKNEAKKFDTKQTLGEYIYISNILSGYKDNFYPLPFLDYLSDQNLHRKAMILSLARQESRFIQSAVSISYALGMMQFMPFVANDWAKKGGLKDFDQDDMFNPKMAYDMANIHLDWLEKLVYSPVFVAYAYNGGIGFTKKMLTRGDLFNAGKFEPFLSMELVYYEESREYAKRVLSNYFIYSQILEPKKNISIIELLSDLLVPAKSDSFRN
ncbi:lytic transglycosylase domain-containing protein [Campylobacter ureolyticus]|uniref:lytic transglycosylase domain-containing protein n=1 Tax=Campylobacter ureolyticus TaxID=827 RepID=UPI0022B52D4E|nr:lytic transglycosylase domain-containing protein [Campylobacter ureolyticus]MCZ6186269.1 lytic transglycosylase domain-containing protein [Campylobacter ureolyticus]MDU5326113.1 lytic transglycosylase domain-containing protein [Campylobacter ureolyticus]